MGRIMCNGSPVARARMKTTTDRMAKAASDCSTRTRTKRTMIQCCRGERRSLPPRLLYLLEASWSRKRSYITEPGFHLPRVFDVAYGECRYTSGMP